MKILSGRQQMEINRSYRAVFRGLNGNLIGTLTMQGAREATLGNSTIPTMTGKQRIRRLIIKCPTVIPTDIKGIYINAKDIAMTEIKPYIA